MAHRGRLNVLANIMGKTYEYIFNEFEGQATPDLTMGDGDVKYHMGYSSHVTTTGGQKVYPAEIESVILELENIEDVAIFGEKHALLGQIIVAKILLKEAEAVESVKKRIRNACLTSR